MLSKRKMTCFVIAMAIVGLGWGWLMTSRIGYESAAYELLESDGAFEVREYPDLMLVTTATKFASRGNDGSFGRLFKYISGNNDSQSKVAMTTPVFMVPETQGSDGQMGFVLPAEVARSSIPNPVNDQVEIAKRSAGRFAVLKFSGRMNDSTKSTMESKLLTWLQDKRLPGDGKIEFAGYDPPWTPGFLRRNEVLIQIE